MAMANRRARWPWPSRSTLVRQELARDLEILKDETLTHERGAVEPFFTP